MNFFKSILVLAIFVSGCCKAPKGETCKCKTEGVVKDFTGLDGCRKLILLSDGTKLEPVSGSIERLDFTKFKDGQKIKFDYTLETGFMSVCMAGKMIRITCLKTID